MGFSGKQLKLNFWNQLHKEMTFYNVYGHKQTPDDQKI